MTIDDQFYVKIGRMTVAFGELDFMVAYLAANMAERLRRRSRSSSRQGSSKTSSRGPGGTRTGSAANSSTIWWLWRVT
jgi:hypothetical protein